MKRLIFPSVIIAMFACHQASAQQSGTVQLKMSLAKQNPQRIVADSSATPPAPSSYTLTNSKQTTNTPLPADGVALPPNGAVVPGNKK